MWRAAHARNFCHAVVKASAAACEFSKKTNRSHRRTLAVRRLHPAAGMNSRADGFSLVEVMVATSVLAVGLVALVQLALLAQAANRAAALVTVAAMLAQNKMEQLRGLSWPDAAESCCEYFDVHGGGLPGGAGPPPGTAFVRRWTIEPVATLPEAARVLQVWVTPVRGAAPVKLVGIRARRLG
jgi:prepilin-type N-terminal cleavage/methylation domain-containing protein